MDATTKKTRQRIKGQSPEQPLPSTPKRGKKVVPVGRVLELQPGESTCDANVKAATTTNVNAATTSKAVPIQTDENPANVQVDEDNVSLKSARSNVTTKSKAKSTTSSARRLELQAELEALDELEKIELEALQKKKEAVLKRLGLKKKLANEVDDDNESQCGLATACQKTCPDQHKQKSPSLPELFPFDKSANLPNFPSPPVEVPPVSRDAVLDDWFAKMPSVPVEHPYAATQDMQNMNDKMEKFMARQSVSKDLPSFSGEPEQWFAFFNAFEHTTNICGLTHHENLARLNKALTGRAKEAVISILTMPSNVPLVMDTLKMLFGRPNQILKSMVEKTRSLPSIHENRPDSIITFANSVTNLVATMKSLNHLGHLNNPTLMEELLCKLPASLQLQWCMAKPEGDESLELFSKWLMKVAMAATSMPSTSSSSSYTRPQKSQANEFPAFKKPVLTAQTKATANSCPKCHATDHALYKCRSFLADSIDNRWDLVSKSKLCFSCLRAGHQTSKCNARRECGVNACKKPHNSLLHRENAPAQGHTNFCGTGKEILLRILPVVLTGPNGKLTVHALLDEGSTVTMLDESVAAKLGLEGERQSLCLQWTNSMMQNEKNSRVVSCGISGVDIGSKQFRLNHVRTISSFALPPQSLDVPAAKLKWPHLADIPFASLKNAQPLLLIGHDNFLLTTPRQVRHARWTDPVATKTWLGWVIHGAANLCNRIDSVLLHHVCYSEQCTENDDANLNEIVTRSFEVEAFATNLPAESLSTDESIGLEILERTVRRVGDHFEAGLLWRSDDVTLPNNKTTALKRLWCMQRKMDRDPEFARLYHAKIEEYLAKGYAFKLTPEQAKVEGPRTFFIPHFAITNVNKPGKIRMVFDAAAKTNGVSLNDALVAGPDLLNDLPAVLWRFRQHRIGFIADVADMFHRVSIRDEDLDAQRFLWRDKHSKYPEVYVMKAMIFGATCSPSTAIYAMNKNAQEFEKEFPGISQTVQKQYYMDDYVDSADIEDEAVKKMLDMIEVQHRGGFNLRNWICSSASALLQIPTELRANNWKQLQLDSRLPTERVLGLWWDPEADAFTFKLNDAKLLLIEKSKTQMTKRNLLKLITSLFDPLGLLAHFLIKARIIFQQVWRREVDWDHEIPAEQMKSWIKWCDQLPKIATVAVPRYYLVPPESSSGPELHIFADASREAYAVVAYFRWGEEDAIVSYVYGKSRVAPLKTLTIPRLELTAALLAARIAKKIKHEHNYLINSTFFWSDSRIALAWIRSGGARYKQYVSNRVAEILESSSADQWNWVPTAENPADDGTRLNHVADLSTGSRWYWGPDFLHHHRSTWPVESPLSTTTEEERPTWNFVGLIREEPSEILPDLTRFSSWVKMIRATAWAFRFAKNIRCPAMKCLDDLADFEIDAAEKRWIRKIQRESFPKEVAALWSTNPVAESSRLYTLHPILDDENILRVPGRTKYSDLLPYNTKYPIILDGKHPYTRLLIRYYHVAALHQGIETVMNNLRQKYWITGMRCAVKSVCRSCQYCKIRHAKPAIPEMAPLPICRVNSKFVAFDQVGIDLFGPIDVKINKRRTAKRYGVIFTCLTVRAVHLELVSSLSTDATIMALRRFMNRRAVSPSDIYTDNGTNFRGASREIRDAIRELQQSPLSDIVKINPMNWHFIPPSSPHMAGAWERLIRSVKTALGAALRERCPTNEVLETTFTEVEFVLNNRPLTEVSVDPSDPRSLTPNDFLRIGTDPVSNWTANGTSVNLKKHWRRAQVLADMFWQRWVKEYLPSLTRRQKWHRTTRTLKIDDAVLIADSNSPRNLWPMGIVTQVYPGRDGQVRVADIRTTNGIYRRPVAKLAILDLQPEKETE